MKPSSIRENIPLAPLTTLGVGGSAEYFSDVHSVAELIEAVTWAKHEGHKITILGGGSNMLVGDAGVSGLVLHMCIKGMEYEERGDSVAVTVGAGYELDACIHEVVNKGLWGLENLSAIPGTVGATPIQNVGAYGVEVKDVITEVTVYDTVGDTIQTLSNEACAFGYRDSLFKTKGGMKYVILDVTFTLSKEPRPNCAYKDLEARWNTGYIPTVREIREAIIAIRREKFPDWQTLGTAGSFFKNPSITEAEFAMLKETYSDMPGFVQSSGTIKVPLGWILDHVLHKKGYREGSVGLYEKQALVLVNYGGATETMIREFSERIIDEVKRATGITVEREVTIVS